MINKFIAKWGWIVRPYQTQNSANYHEGINLLHSVRDVCKSYDRALFTSEMVWAHCLRGYPNLTRSHVQRCIELLQEFGELGDIGTVRQGGTHLRVLHNV